VEFDAGAAAFVRSRTWHASQAIEALPDGRLRMTLQVSIDSALRSWVLGFGSAARVIAPASFATAIADELRRAAERYK
jgi:predicted DNA-binding transcriptional regulator YafY